MKRVPYLVSILQNKQKMYLYALCALWLVSEVIFWGWWIQSEHVVSFTKFFINSALLFWNSFMILYFFYFILRMKKANPEIEIPSDWRVAMVVTKAPSEPFSVVKKTLLQMIAQKTRHANWLADEDPTEEVIRWCKEHQVYISTRKNNIDYHRKEWPRRTKCKEGNLAYFYDHFGYDRYDFVIQLDADHVPARGYLEAMLRPFADPKVGYVSAPSICDTNAKDSWIARARLYAEATLHGPLQSGYSNGWAPLCIGSHYAVRTIALKEVGGLGPELAEDHSTTFMMNVHGWKGVHAIDAIANGEGPGTFADAMTQEFQWSRSLIVLFLTVTPKYLKFLPSRLKFQFLFSQLWYPFFVTFIIVGTILPIISLLNGEPWLNINYLQFLLFGFFPTFFAILVVWFLRKIHLLRPVTVPILSWEVMLFQLARWPWVFWAFVMALITIIGKKHVEFKVTPKGVIQKPQIHLPILAPYIMVVFISSLIVLLAPKQSSIMGYYYFVFLNASMYLALILIAIYKQKSENRRPDASLD